MDYYGLLRVFKDFRVGDEQKLVFDGVIIMQFFQTSEIISKD
jgi:hypothetical protein